MKRLSRRWQAHLFAREIYYVWGEDNDVLRTGLEQNLEIAANWSLRAEIALADEQDRSWWEWSVRLHLFH